MLLKISEEGEGHESALPRYYGVKKRMLETLNIKLFRNVSVQESYRFKALITLEQVNTTEWSKKNKNLN